MAGWFFVVFSSPTFLFLFLPLTLLGYHAIPVHWRRGRNTWLLAASGLFYLWGAGSAILAILLVSVSSFGGAYIAWLIMRRARPNYRDREARKITIPSMVTLLIILVPLIAFKYLPQISTLDIPHISSRLMNMGAQSWALPLGISFFTFHALSFVIDSARAGRPLTTSFPSYLLYLFVFPHQIAGPIVRYAEIGAQIQAVRRITAKQMGYGITRFTWGLAKKVLIADNCGLVANAMFDNVSNPNLMSGTGAWLGAVAYALQIYFDFSGYSDMAIGLAQMFGFQFPENFRSPYTAANITDFWRRWHITLTKWFRDYVYIPLGGNRRGVWVEYGALLLVFLLTSLWHGALAGFLVWGGLHSAALLLERVTGLRNMRSLVVLRRAVTLLFVIVAWVPFRALEMPTSMAIWRAMLAGPWDAISPTLFVALTPFTIAAMATGALSFVMPSRRTGFHTVFGQSETGTLTAFRWKTAWVLVPLTLVVTLSMVLHSNFSPFLYFQF
ncbi:MBOAT family O-acyltransferase [Cryobacterium arcticum]|uniref:Membrane-bound O-acyltransferase family protein n=1 Tax=Cryobacterium arcticum TaxID=670052 RepID=A0A317ZQA2_9MICO|nr:MBOAT family O-acyltransferase [Cryobacterium arcticum]PXA68676.1 membrane-bound O-acyltransferase family protein [Cryobacterium arcticum]